MANLKQPALRITLKLKHQRGHSAATFYRLPYNQPIIFFGQFFNSWLYYPFSKQSKAS